jgi:hypothetical protein
MSIHIQVVSRRSARIAEKRRKEFKHIFDDLYVATVNSLDGLSVIGRIDYLYFTYNQLYEMYKLFLNEFVCFSGVEYTPILSPIIFIHSEGYTQAIRNFTFTTMASLNRIFDVAYQRIAILKQRLTSWYISHVSQDLKGSLDKYAKLYKKTKKTNAYKEVLLRHVKLPIDVINSIMEYYLSP